jgi:hypothetical protein
MMVPGAIVDETELWPTDSYPAVPVLLETCQIVFSGRGHHKNPLEHILWIYSHKAKEWRQVAHVSAHQPEEWIPPIAAVAAKYVHPRVIPPAPDLHQAARRIAALIETELLSLPDNGHRRNLLQTAVDYLALRNADIGASPKAYQMPLRSHDHFFELDLPADPINSGWSLRERLQEGDGPARIGM